MIKKWHDAQEYERSFWERQAKHIESGELAPLDWYPWKAGELEKLLSPFVDAPTRRTAKVLEIGSGPVGIVNFLGWGERYAIDPLEHFYRQSKTLTQLRTSDVTYLRGTGEQLPFDDETFSLVIMDNVLDHTYDPSVILQQIRRIVKADGLLYLAVNIHTAWGSIVHRLLTVLPIDRGHPHTFTQHALRDLLRANRFEIRKEVIEDYQKIRRRYRQSPSLRDRLKGYTGVAEFQFHAIARKC